MELRDELRYGKFFAYCEELGKVIIDISILGFGESINIIQNGKIVCGIDTLEDYLNNTDGYEETDDMLRVWEYHIQKPFKKCIKRYK